MTIDFCSITLAAGLGSRMPADMPPKSCCKIGPVSVIENALEGYEHAGVRMHVVVVGAKASQVMEEVCRTRRDVLFAYQSRQRGTGDAVACAIDLLDGDARPQHVLISAGDKVVAPEVVRGIVETYAASHHDMCMLAGPASHNPEGGRVIIRDGRVRAIVEFRDIRARQLAAALRTLGESERPRTIARLRSLIEKHLPSGKLGAFAPELATLLGGDDAGEAPWTEVIASVEGIPPGFNLRSGWVSTEAAAASDLCNLSLYVARFEPLQESVRRLGARSPQGECYFTDVIEDLASSGHSIGLVKAQDPEDVMAFNTLEQLEDVRRAHAVRVQSTTQYPTLKRWDAFFSRQHPETLAAQAVGGLCERIGSDRTGIVIRSPGRINILGRHVDHQGGTCNLMAIDREVVLAASARDDDTINLWNLDGASYPHRSFTIAELARDIVWDDWLRTLESQYLKRIASGTAGDWANYVKGAALRLQHRFRDRPLRGMDAFVSGNVPVGAGLSSSSALVVAAAEALIELNALNVRPKELIDLCGEGEWFVGTRGGSADHAAIKLGREQEVVSVSFFPFEVVGRHPFPDECCLMICHSGASAKKTENAAARFNTRIACYRLAREIAKRRFPHLAGRIVHLRDINTRTLDVSLPALYSIIKQLPLRLDVADVETFAKECPDVADCIAGLDLSQLEFPVRDTALFGLAEIERAKHAGRYLDAHDAHAFGRLMGLSHNGDRIERSKDGRSIPATTTATDDYMDSLIERARSLGPLTEEGAALHQQPGAYACSTPDIDSLVDLAASCPGVLGAQLAGAGLGGCAMILLHCDAAQYALDALEQSYYAPRDLEPQLFLCQPSRGSQVLTSVEAG